MTKATREGRPPRRIEAIHALKAWLDLCREFPLLVDLEIKVQSGGLTSFEVQRSLDDACSKMLSTPPLRALPSEPGKSREENLRSAAEHFQAASHHLAMMQQIKSSVERACSEAEGSVQHCKNLMLAIALTPSPLDAHATGCAARVLKAAGLTSPISRAITDSQLERMAAILKEQSIDDTPAPSIPHPPCPVNLDWKPGNPWMSMPSEIPGYNLKERFVTPQEQGLAAVICLGLPPVANLAEFGPVAAFQSANTNQAKRRECWKLLEQWLRANKVRGWDGPVTMKMREQAWVFMFAVKYGFVQDVAEFRKVRFPSPWHLNAVIEAERV